MILEKYELHWRKSDFEVNYQCMGCMEVTPLLSGEDELAEFNKVHECGKRTVWPLPEDEEVEVKESDPAPEEDEVPKNESDKPTREGLEAMTKKDIMKGFAPEWDGTKAELIDHLLGEEEEEDKG